MVVTLVVVGLELFVNSKRWIQVLALKHNLLKNPECKLFGKKREREIYIYIYICMTRVCCMKIGYSYSGNVFVFTFFNFQFQTLI